MRRINHGFEKWPAHFLVRCANKRPDLAEVGKSLKFAATQKLDMPRFYTRAINARFPCGACMNFDVLVDRGVKVSAGFWFGIRLHPRFDPKLKLRAGRCFAWPRLIQRPESRRPCLHLMAPSDRHHRPSK